MRRLASSAALRLPPLLAGCTVGPDYHAPAAAAVAGAAGSSRPRPARSIRRLVERVRRSAARRAGRRRRWPTQPGPARGQARLAEARANRDAVRGRAAAAGRRPAARRPRTAEQERPVPDRQHPRLRARLPPVRSRLRRKLGNRSVGPAHARRSRRRRARAEAAEAARRDVMLQLDRRGRARLCRSARRAGRRRDGAGDCGAPSRARPADAAALQGGRGDRDRGGARRMRGARQRARAVPDAAAPRGGGGLSHRRAGRRAARGRWCRDLRRRRRCPPAPTPSWPACAPNCCERRPDVRRGRARAGRRDRRYRRRHGRSVPALQPDRRHRPAGARARRPVRPATARGFQIGPSFSWPIFSGGTIRAQIRAADARADQAPRRAMKRPCSARWRTARRRSTAS